VIVVVLCVEFDVAITLTAELLGPGLGVGCFAGDPQPPEVRQIATMAMLANARISLLLRANHPSRLHAAKPPPIAGNDSPRAASVVCET
jgi:hypothetical protein